MSIPVPPAPGAIVDQAGWYAWDIALRYEAMERDRLYRESAVTREEAYRAGHLAGMAANTAALNRQADAGIAVAKAQLASVTAFNNVHSDEELMAQFMSALVRDGGTAMRGSASVQSIAQGLLTAYRTKFPAPAPAPAP